MLNHKKIGTFLFRVFFVTFLCIFLIVIILGVSEIYNLTKSIILTGIAATVSSLYLYPFKIVTKKVW